MNGLYDGIGTLYDRDTGVLIFSGSFRDGKALTEEKEPSDPSVSEPEVFPDIKDLPDLDDNKNAKGNE